MRIPAESVLLRRFLCTFWLMHICHCTTGQKIYPDGPEAVLFNVNADPQNSLEVASELLPKGYVIAIPTDTVYGFAADAQNTTAIRKLYEIKERQSSKPVAICVHDVGAISQWARVEHLSTELLNKLLPGPVTIVLDRTSQLNSELNPNDTKIGVRIPNHKFLLALLAEVKKPIALTSANKSGGENALMIKEFADLWSLVESVFSGGTLGTNRAGSTVVDLSNDGIYKIIREGGYLDQTLDVLNDYGLKSV